MKFCVGTKQRPAAAYAFINAGIIPVFIFSSEGRFRALLACDVVLVGGQLLSPLGVALADLIGHLTSLFHVAPALAQAMTWRMFTPLRGQIVEYYIEQGQSSPRSAGRPLTLLEARL